MAWQSLPGMGPQNQNGGGNGNAEAGQQSNQPQGTEYTLQGMLVLLLMMRGYMVSNVNGTGVMRFLQTEWHRHERDRNAWEIERQEMKGRIARLEGSTRKSDASQKSLKRYVNMLERALKERDAQVRALQTGADAKLKESVRDGKEKESLAVKSEKRRELFAFTDRDVLLIDL
jgi:striatin 1/3/4